VQIGWIGIGSNVGDRLFFCREAVNALQQTAGVSVTRPSSLYETVPMEYTAQPPFYNAVVQIETGLAPHDLLTRCQEIEKRLGRTREIPKGPRTLDLDLLCYGRWIVEGADLILPHPAIAFRPFVLIPLNEIAPDFVHPVSGLSPQQMLDRLDPVGVQKVAPPSFHLGRCPDPVGRRFIEHRPTGGIESSRSGTRTE
jgi:2-amino-4-hydroxy-6-hydroxymethyldihydropteridine diphosphokinase